jgi:adenine-specific DNA-methyltransferase
MRAEILNFLKKQYSDDPLKLDRLVVTAFVQKLEITVELNVFIKNYLIDDGSLTETGLLHEFLSIYERYDDKWSFETLIELFEFVISPTEKVINGAVYTPKHIREYIVGSTLTMFNFDVSDIRTTDISCGCGGFLMTVASELYNLTDKSFFDIYKENIYGLDIANYSIHRTKILLTLYALWHGEDVETFDFNIHLGNALNFDWNRLYPEITSVGGFDLVVGNPPYVCSRHMDAESLDLMRNWKVAQTGHPDLYIPFFQIGNELLNKQGVLGYITVNSFLKSVNGRALRQYFADNSTNLSILSFGGEQIFTDRNTYTCICYIRSGQGGHLAYLKTQSRSLFQVSLNELRVYEYDTLNHLDGWNLVNEESTTDFINSVEAVGIPFKKLYQTRNGIATLKNDVYKFKAIKSDENFYYLEDGGNIFPIEKGICRPIVNANRLKVVEDLERIKEQIIFPYDKNTNIIPEQTMEENFPFALRFLESKKEVLAKRDKGLGKYEAWYAYGRRQSMDINAFKLFFPHICERPIFVLCTDKDLLFYNGIAIISDDLDELRVIKKLMESDLFYNYILNTTKDYSSGYISMSRNYLKNFGVYQFNDQQVRRLLDLSNPNAYLEELYELIELEVGS